MRLDWRFYTVLEQKGGSSPTLPAPPVTSRANWSSSWDELGPFCAVITTRKKPLRKGTGGLAFYPAHIVVEAAGIVVTVFPLRDQTCFYVGAHVDQTAMILFTEQAAAVTPDISGMWGKLDYIPGCGD